MPQPQKCAWCRQDMTLTGYIDLPNAFQVFKKVKKVLKENAEEEKKESGAARMRQLIMERISHGHNPEACPMADLFKPDETDKQWVARVVERAGNLYRDDWEQPRREQEIAVHHDRPTNLPGRVDIEVAKAFYPVEVMRLWTKELTDKILGSVRKQIAVLATPNRCKGFCKSL